MQENRVQSLGQKDPLEEEILPTPVFLPGKSQGLEWVAISFSRGSSQPRDQTHRSYVSCIGRRFLYHSSHLGLSSTGSIKSPVLLHGIILHPPTMLLWPQNYFQKYTIPWDLPGAPVAETPHSQCKGPGLSPQGTRSHMPQLKIPHAATKTRGSQINKY